MNHFGIGLEVEEAAEILLLVSLYLIIFFGNGGWGGGGRLQGVEFWCTPLICGVFSWYCSYFHLPENNISRLQFNQKWPVRRKTTMQTCDLKIMISYYLFVFIYCCWPLTLRSASQQWHTPYGPCGSMAGSGNR